MAEYLYKNKGTNLSKFIFSLRSKTTDIKTYQPYKYADNLCSACEISEDTIKHLILCEKLAENSENMSMININQIYESDEENILKIGKIIHRKYMKRKELEEKEDSDDGFSHPRAPVQRIFSSSMLSTVQCNIVQIG